MVKLGNISLGFVFILIYAMLIDQFLGFMDFAGHPWGITPQMPTIQKIVFGCIVAAGWEELVFRFAPLEIAKRLDGGFLIPIIIISSALFGWIHNGVGGILIQGVMGAVFCWVYIKNGWSYWSSFALHSMWNMFCSWFL